MKRNLQCILSATMASFLAFTVMAQDNLPNNDRLHGAAKTSDIIGMSVNNHQDEKLGSVEDLAVDLQSGRIVQVILSSGGFFGVGDRLTAVPPGALRHDAEGEVLHLDASKDKIKNAPEFTTAKWAENSNSDHISSVYKYHGQESSFTFIHNDQVDRAANRNANALREQDRLMVERQQMIPASHLGLTQRASKLIGVSVKNQQDENVGKVNNLLVDLQSGRILAVVITSGGFLGIGNELSPVPPTALRFNADRDALVLDATKDMLIAAPHFKSSEWPDFSQPVYADRVYRAYKQEPYFTTDADNTARNVRDRNDRMLTPMDQGNSKADTDTTAEIRRGILAGRNMSLNAKNVKIITNNGRVTLRGPVKSEDEKRQIGAIANRIARLENVDNQLEVTAGN